MILALNIDQFLQPSTKLGRDELVVERQHLDAVFEHRMGRLPIGSWEPQKDVAAFDAPRGWPQPISLSREFADPFVFALTRANLLLSVNPTTSGPARFSECLSTVFANGFVPLVGTLPTRGVAAFRRAIRAILSKSYFVSPSVSRFHLKRFAAVLTCELGQRNTSRLPAVDRLMGRDAFFAAKTLRCLTFATRGERFAALFASVVNDDWRSGHRLLSSVSTPLSMALSGSLVK